MRKTELAQLAVRKLRPINESRSRCHHYYNIAILITTILIIALTNSFCDGQGNRFTRLCTQ